MALSECGAAGVVYEAILIVRPGSITALKPYTQLNPCALSPQFATFLGTHLSTLNLTAPEKDALSDAIKEKADDLCASDTFVNRDLLDQDCTNGDIVADIMENEAT